MRRICKVLQRVQKAEGGGAFASARNKRNKKMLHATTEDGKYGVRTLQHVAVVAESRQHHSRPECCSTARPFVNGLDIRAHDGRAVAEGSGDWLLGWCSAGGGGGGGGLLSPLGLIEGQATWRTRCRSVHQRIAAKRRRRLPNIYMYVWTAIACKRGATLHLSLRQCAWLLDEKRAPTAEIMPLAALAPMDGKRKTLTQTANTHTQKNYIPTCSINRIKLRSCSSPLQFLLTPRSTCVCFLCVYRF